MTSARYSLTAILLHWSMAALLAFQIGMGFAFEGQPRGPGLFTAYQLHKSLGMLILLLSLVRLAVRLTRPVPAARTDSAVAALLAKLVHAAFYGIMILAPLTGWIIVSSARIKVPTLLFGTLPLPHLPVGKDWHDPAETAHAAMAWVAIGLFALHVIGALRHQIVKNEPMLERMIPLSFPTRGRVIAAILVIVTALGLIGGWANNMRFGAGPSPVAAGVAPQREVERAIAPPPETVVERQITPAADKATAPVAAWQVQQGGRLGFSASWNGSAIPGSFGRWTAAIRFSPDDLAASSIRVEIDLASASTSDVQRDEMLGGEAFFDVPAHPRAVYTSNRIMRLRGDRYRASGSLSLHGKSRPITIDFTLNIKGRDAKVSGGTTIDRTDFGVGSGEWTATDQIAAAVAVRFDFMARREAATN